MLKDKLREKNYVQSDKNMKTFIFHIAAAILIMLGIAVTFFLVILIRGEIINRWENIMSVAESAGDTINDSLASAFKEFMEIIKVLLFIVLIVIEVVVYFFFVGLFTSLFCEKKFNNTHLKILKYTQMPVCLCKEALKPYQIVLSYIISMILVYVPMFFICIFAVDFGFMFSLIFFIILTAPDVVLMGYILYLANTEKPDYISIESHVYGMTLFKRYSYNLNKNRKKKYRPNSYYRKN